MWSLKRHFSTAGERGEMALMRYYSRWMMMQFFILCK
jgi:hypothetical protein